jgi:hypothetical protein
MYRNKKTIELLKFMTGLVVDTEEELEDFAAGFGYTRKIGNVFSNGMNEIEIYRDKNNIVHIEEA